MTDIVEHWGVDVRVNGQGVLTIESNSMSGIENIQDHADAVRTCAMHLLSFIGEPDLSAALSCRDREIERLREALRPFAEYPWDVEGVPDDAPLLPVNSQLKVGHVSDARMALYTEQTGNDT